MTAGDANSNSSLQSNADAATIASFGDEWQHFDQSTLSDHELQRTFAEYFSIFPWHMLSSEAEGFDMGCGSGRWAKLVAPRVGRLNCIDASEEALGVARRNLSEQSGVRFLHASTESVPLEQGSQDFGYSLGVLHHIPDTAAAINSCTRLLKPGAPFLVYLYYRFDNRPLSFRMIWKTSELIRSMVCRMPAKLKFPITDAIALFVYWPLARFARLAGKIGFDTRHFPLRYYRDKSFYTMRTDSRDRFGTPLEKRFTRIEILEMMESASLTDITFSQDEPFWCAVGNKV